jgi:hypothetical protein
MEPEMTSSDNLDAPLWGAAAICKYAGLTERQFYHKAERGLLPVSKVGRTFVTTRRRLQAVWNGVSSDDGAAA